MQKKNIGIVSWGAVSALGGIETEIWQHYQAKNTYLSLHPDLEEWTGRLPAGSEEEIDCLQKKYPARILDRSVWLGLLAGEKAYRAAGWDKQTPIGINLGSSRGATGLFEQAYQQFTRENLVSPLTSPMTTLGNISSNLAQFLKIESLNISHSVTCSTALQAILNGIAWLESGRLHRFLAGGVEAPLTAFTLAQMKALRIYARADLTAYPCRAMDLQKTTNTMVLGEGAAVFALEADPENPLAWISGIGYANEAIDSPTGISENGDGFQGAMRMALTEAGLSTVDCVVCHGPGTRRGDQAEWNAIQAVFEENPPPLTSNKWKIGHTLGASGGLSLELALLMMHHQKFVPIPYLAKNQKKPKKMDHILVNATGFGGNGVSLIISRGELLED